MKITKEYLRKIIKEELERVQEENTTSPVQKYLERLNFYKNELEKLADIYYRKDQQKFLNIDRELSTVEKEIEVISKNQQFYEKNPENFKERYSEERIDQFLNQYQKQY